MQHVSQNNEEIIKRIRSDLQSNPDLLKAFNGILKQKPQMNPSMALDLARAEITDGDDGSSARVFRNFGHIRGETGRRRKGDGGKTASS